MFKSGNLFVSFCLKLFFLRFCETSLNFLLHFLTPICLCIWIAPTETFYFIIFTALHLCFLDTLKSCPECHSSIRNIFLVIPWINILHRTEEDNFEVSYSKLLACFGFRAAFFFFYHYSPLFATVFIGISRSTCRIFK